MGGSGTRSIETVHTSQIFALPPKSVSKNLFIVIQYKGYLVYEVV